MRLDTLVANVEQVLHPLDQWSSSCHAASIKVVRALGDLVPMRVARGFCENVVSQHSWVILGHDCYDQSAMIIDPTLWSYDEEVEGIWTGTYRDRKHTPHGRGNIFEWGKPANVPAAQAVTLEPQEPFSTEARGFLRLIGPLDMEGWRILANAPVEGWPAEEILPAIDDTFDSCWVPIDIIGMLTDRNPNGLYLPGEADR